MREAYAVLGKDQKVLLMQLPGGGSSVAIPDSRNLWEFIWEHRDEITGIAHTHPGGGIPGPSYEDLTTFRAIEKGLGKRLEWWIATKDFLSLYVYEDREYVFELVRGIGSDTPWVTELLELSYREEKCRTS